MILDNPDVINIDHQSVYNELMQHKIENFTSMEFRHLKPGLYYSEGADKDKNDAMIGKEGKEYFCGEHRMDLKGEIYTDDDVAKFTMDHYDQLKNKFRMEYWSDWHETFSAKANFDINAIHSILRFCDDYDGIEYSFGYAGRDKSMAPIHFEDDDLMSVNLLLFGIKIWVVVNRNESEKMKEIIFKQLAADVGSICSSIFRHKTTIIHPGLLKLHNISYSIVVQRPGQIFVSNIATMHQTNSVTKTLAGACNFATNTWIDMFDHDRCLCNSTPKFDKSCLRFIRTFLLERSRCFEMSMLQRQKYEDLLERRENEENVSGKIVTREISCQTDITLTDPIHTALVQNDTIQPTTSQNPSEHFTMDVDDDIPNFSECINGLIKSIDFEPDVRKCPYENCIFKSTSEQKYKKILRRHIREKHMEKGIKCPIEECAMTLARRETLINHLRIKHKMSVEDAKNMLK